MSEANLVLMEEQG